MKKIGQKLLRGCSLQQREERLLVGQGRAVINEAENKFLEEKNYIHSHKPLVGFLPVLRGLLKIEESK